MKKHILTFLKRGLLAAAGGPVILAIVYGILGVTGAVDTLTPGEVCKGILSITVMAYIAAGITTVYTVEALPLPLSILIHAGALYLDYLIMYLFNSWIPGNLTGIGIFTAIFVGGFGLIWLCIYASIRKTTQRINRQLQ